MYMAIVDANTGDAFRDCGFDQLHSLLAALTRDVNAKSLAMLRTWVVGPVARGDLQGERAAAFDAP